MNRVNKGFTAIVMILVLVALIAVVLVVSYLALSGQKSTQSIITRNPSPVASSSAESQMMPSPSPVSSSLDLNTIESELNNTNVGIPDADLNSMQKDASSL